MTNKRREFPVGIRQRPTTNATSTEGEERVDSADNKKKVYLDSSERSVVTEDQVQTVTNKVIDVDNNIVSNIEVDNLKSGVLDIDLTAVSASDDTLASAKAIKAYVDDSVAGKDQASEITYDNATSGLTATNVQDAIDEVEGRVDTVETGLSDHLADAVDAHDASAISSVASGNLAATDVQTALDELQSDVDTRALDSDLTDHIADTSTHGVAGDVVGTSDTQTLTSKTIDADNNTISNLAHGAEVDNPSSGVHGVTGSVVGTTDTQDLSNKKFADPISFDQVATPANPAAGDNKLYFKADDKLYKLDSAGLEEEVGSGTGGAAWDTANRVNLFADGDAENADAADFTDSTNMTTSLTSTSSNVGRGLQAFQFTSTAASETAESASFTVPLGYRSEDRIFLTFLAKCDADFTVKLKDKTNTVDLISEEIVDNGSVYTQYQLVSSFPSTMASASFEIESSASQTVYIDDVFIGFEGQQRGISASNITNAESYTPTFTGFGTVSVSNIQYWRQGEFLHVLGNFTTGTPTTTEGRVSLPSGLVSSSDYSSLEQSGIFFRALTSGSNGGPSLIEPSVSYITFGPIDTFSNTAVNPIDKKNGDALAGAGHVLHIDAKVKIEGWTATSDLVVTDTDNVAPARAQGINSTALVDSIPTFIGFDNADFDDDSQFTNLNTTHNTTYTGTTYWTCPKSGKYNLSAMVTVQDSDIGANERTIIRVYKNGSTIMRELTHKTEATPSIQTLSLTINDVVYFEKGDEISIAVNAIAGGPVNVLAVEERNWFSVYRIDKNPVVATGNEVAYLFDKKTSGTAGGSSTLNTVQTRTLNTLDGDQNFISLSSDQFTLQPGKYALDFSCPAFEAGRHQAFLYSVTGSSYILDGVSSFGSAADSVVTWSRVRGSINITTATTYEIRHWTELTKATNGLGEGADVDTSNPQSSEVYTNGEIRKLK